MVSKHMILTEESIKKRIYNIRGRQVMLDRDLADLYGVEVKYLKRQVRRNIDRFPENFMFQLTKDEFEDWRCQIVTSKSDKMGLRHYPFAFSRFEKGAVEMLNRLASR